MPLGRPRATYTITDLSLLVDQLEFGYIHCATEESVLQVHKDILLPVVSLVPKMRQLVIYKGRKRRCRN